MTTLLILAGLSYWLFLSSEDRLDPVNSTKPPALAKAPSQTAQLRPLDRKPMPVDVELPPTSPKPSPAKKDKQPEVDFKKPLEHLEVEVIGEYAVVQGDILVGQLKDRSQPVQRMKLKPSAAAQLWPTNEIPFAIHADVPNPDRILEVLTFFNENTSVRFVRYDGQQDTLVFQRSDQFCGSYLGYHGGGQPILIADKCGQREVAHEIMHALGFIHEHSRPDRDDYIEVIWENIRSGYEFQFAIVPQAWMLDYSGSAFDFDFQSIMLYHPTSFSKAANQPTLRSVTNTPIGVNTFLSARDLQRLEWLYRD